MDRIQHPSATSDHLFTEGNPSLGIPATTVTATVLNGWQEELMHLIETAGLDPSVADTTQVLQALSLIFQPRGVTTDVRFLTVLTSDFVSGAKTESVQGLGDVGILVQGNGSGNLTLTLSGVVPAGCRVTVVNWSPAALTVTTTVANTGSAEPLGLYDWGQLVMQTGQDHWFTLSIKDSKNIRTATASAVYTEAQRAQAAEAALSNSLNSAISNESQRAQAEEAQLHQLLAAETVNREGYDSSLGYQIAGLSNQLSGQGSAINGLAAVVAGSKLKFTQADSGYSASFADFAASYGSKNAQAISGFLKKLAGEDGFELFLYLKSPTRDSGAVSGMAIQLNHPDLPIWAEFNTLMQAARSAKTYLAYVRTELPSGGSTGMTADGSIRGLTLGVSSVTATAFSLFPLDWKGFSTQVENFTAVGSYGELFITLKIPGPLA